MTYFQTLIKSIYSPLKAFQDLLYSDHSVLYGWITTLGFAILYTMTTMILAARSFLPLTPPGLPIPAEQYYFYQVFFTIPVGVVGVGLSYLVARGGLNLFSINPGTQQLWGPISIASVLPSFFTMWVPETFIAILFNPANEWTHITFDITRIAAGTVWTIILTVIAIKVTHQAKWWQCAIIGIVSSGIMGTLMGICYR
jgi:hypothetical protein